MYLCVSLCAQCWRCIVCKSNIYCYMVSCIKYRELLTSKQFVSISSSLLFLLLWKKMFSSVLSSSTLHPSPACFHLSCPPVSSLQCVTSVFSLRPLLPPALPVVHSSGWEWTSQLAPLKETHISGCALPLHLSFSLRLKHGPCQCTGWTYHSPSLPLSLSPSVLLPGSAVTATTRLCRSVKV